MFSFAGHVQPSDRAQAQGREVQADQQGQSKKSGGAQRQTEVGANARVRVSRGGRLGPLLRVARFRRNEIVSGLFRIEVFSEFEPARDDSRFHGAKRKF